MRQNIFFFTLNISRIKLFNTGPQYVKLYYCYSSFFKIIITYIAYNYY